MSIVIPAFNEERRIEKTILAISEYMAARSRPYEIVVSDDGSTDTTCEIVARLQREAVPINLVRADRNRGKGSAVRLGVTASKGSLVLVTDADLATPIEEVERLLAQIHAGADIAFGSRGMRESQLVVRQPAHRELMGRFFNLLVQVLLLPGVHDTQCGFKLFRGEVARRLFAQCAVNGFSYDVEVLGLSARAGHSIAEVPVRWFHMNHSKVSLGRDGVRMFQDLLRVAFRLRTRRYDLAALEVRARETHPAVLSEKP
jgi:dolichyl-phosphate beta-glucosyltransferase